MADINYIKNRYINIYMSGSLSFYVVIQNIT
jgi:hypothetical protein